MRGRYRILLGMAAGVGKTYRMLQEGRHAQTEGRDVVIGYLEPHDRPETSALADELEVVPRLRAGHGTLDLEEMDADAVIRRAPELALIDELAHTNAPGMRNEKRYQDIDEVLAAGIDVISTVNIQHLESLNDAIAELTDVKVRETFPDRILEEADEVVLVDLTPEALQERLRAGKVYPREAARLGAQLDALWVRDPGKQLSEEEQVSLAALRRLAIVLGAHFLEEEGDELVATVRRIVYERGTTYVFVGTPDESRKREILRGSLVSALVRELPGVDIRVVANRADRPEALR
jgi:K+-sensing histidine kinase KdpD